MHSAKPKAFTGRNLRAHSWCTTRSRLSCAARSAVVGEVDQEEDGDMDWSSIVAEPLKPVVH